MAQYDIYQEGKNIFTLKCENDTWFLTGLLNSSPHEKILKINSGIVNKKDKSFKITALGGFAFEGYNWIEEIELPDTINYIDSYAFANCKNLKNVIINNKECELARNCFSNCKSLKSINIPLPTVRITDRMFFGCESLQKVDLTSSHYTVEYIDQFAFSNCYGLKEIVGLEKVKCFGTAACSVCTSLKEIDLSSCETISNYTFQRCINLNKVNLGHKLKIIEPFAFSECSSLEEIIFPNVDSENSLCVEENAFYSCENLKHVEILSNNIKFDKNVFTNCSKLKHINYMGKTIDFQSDLNTFKIVKGNK